METCTKHRTDGSGDKAGLTSWGGNYRWPKRPWPAESTDGDVVESVHDVRHAIHVFFDFEGPDPTTKRLDPHAEAAGFGDKAFRGQAGGQVQLVGINVGQWL